MKWLPLPKIAHGIAVYPYTPSSSSAANSRPPTTYSTIQSPLLSPQIDAASILTTASASSDSGSTNPADYACLLPLEVGDELFILEQQGQWYRGYVLSAVEEGRKPNTAPLGCFPRTHVQIKEYLDMDPNESNAAEIMMRRTDDRPLSSVAAPWQQQHATITPDALQLSRSVSESLIYSSTPRKSYHAPTTARRPDSVVDMTVELDAEEHGAGGVPVPSLPLARFDQSTITGSSEPLVDEIGACVSEWNCLLYKYLEERRYAAFNAVRDQINYLFQARRQLLDQALSKEELARLRKDIIHRMVILNMSQDRDMIIRHPERGYILDANSTSLATIFRMHWKYTLSEHIPVTSMTLPLSRPSIASSSQTTTTTTAADPLPSPQPQQQTTTPISTTTTKGAKFHHLFLELKACVAHFCQPGEFTELYFSLYNREERRFLTEQFVVVLNYNGMPKDEQQIGRLQTLFADLSMHDLNEHLYLVCRVVRLGNMKSVDREKDALGNIGSHASILFGGVDASSSKQSSVRSHGLCRRPFGCAVLHLGSLLQKADSSPAGGPGDLLSPGSVNGGAGGGAASYYSRLAPSEHDIRIYTAASESTFGTLHEDIINNNTKDFVKHPRAEMLCVYLRLFYGQLDDVLKTNAALLQGVPRTLRLGFPDVVFPDDERNELYVTLDAGDFVQFGRSRNVQVTVCVRDNATGEAIENALSAGAGAPPTTYWESMIFYHEQRPKWGEMIKVQIRDSHVWERAHLFFTVRYRSSNSAAEVAMGSDKPVAMGFLPLFLPPFHRYFVADGSHTLILYKYDKQLAHPRVYLDNVAWCSRSTAPFNLQNQELAAFWRKQQQQQRPLQQQHSPSLHSLKESHRTFSSSSLNGSVSSIVSDSQSSSVLSDPASVAAAAKLSATRDTLTITTFLCSTHFTENETLVKLLNWRSILDVDPDGSGYEDVLSVLDKFTFVGEMEVVKFLNDIFDALLSILTYRHKDEEKGVRLHDEALAAIVCVLGIVQDRRFSNFRPVLDVYVEQRFSFPEGEETRKRTVNMHGLVYEPMLKGLLRLCTNASEPKNAKRLRSSMKVWEYLFRFVVRSREMQQLTEDEGERSLRDIMFKEEIQQLLDMINAMVGPDQPSFMIGTQTLALQHFADILGELRRVFSSKQMVDITCRFVNASAHVTGKLVGYRLCMILAIVKGPVFNDQTCRSGLAKNVFKWINVWINSYMAAAKNVIFSRQADGGDGGSGDHQQQTRLPRAQWLEYLRLSLTILSEVLDKVRRLSGMASLGISSASISSPSLSALSRPISLATSGDEDMTEDSQGERMTITEMALQLLPQLLNAYKDLQRLTMQAIHASGIVADNTAAGAGITPSVRSRHSLSVRRDRSNSISPKHSSSTSSRELAAASDGSSKFSVVLQALATSPTTPFPSSYPFQSTSIKNNPALVAAGNVAAMVTTGLLDITVVILELFYLAPRQQWIDYLYTMYENEGTEALATFLRQVCHTCLAILFGDSMLKLDELSARDDDSMHHVQDESAITRKLPDHWLNLSLIAHQIVLCHILAPAVNVFELPEFLAATEQYDEEEAREEEEEEEEGGGAEKKKRSMVNDLWRTFFVGLLRVVSSPRLEIEQDLPQTQRVIWKLTDNMKGAVGAKTLLALWHLAGPKKSRVFGSGRASALAATIDSTRVNGHHYSGSVDTIAEEERFMSAEEGEDDEDVVEDTDLLAAKVMINQMKDEELEAANPKEDKEKPAISRLQLALIPVILRPLCGVGLTLHDKVRSAAVSILADIIVIELQSFGELSRVQNLLISTIDLLVMTENKGDETIKSKIIPEMVQEVGHRLIEQKVSEPLAEPARQMVESIGKFLDLLLQIRSLPLENDEFVDERTSATLKLMEFIQVIQRQDIYVKYVHQLVEMHLSNNNYVEAAFTLRLHANLLSWDPNEELPAIEELDLPAETAFARKEKLYWNMLSYLEKGHAWEICIKLCKELAAEYESTVYDYMKLSEVLQREAQYVQDIMQKERCFAEYFRVGFYGRGFPPSVRNKQFVYRGMEWEKIASFVERMQNQHPNAQILTGKQQQSGLLFEDDLAGELDAQYLQITAVTPEPDEKTNTELLQNPLVPDNIKKYYASNDVCSFSFSRPFDKQGQQQQQQQAGNASKPEMDFLNLWTKKTIFVCEESFPTTARRSEVISVQEIEISPIENAVLAIEKKNHELNELNNKYAVHLQSPRKAAGSININPFSMALNGAVDAPVNGGVALYRKAFLTDDYWEKNPDMRPWIRRLKEAIYEQVIYSFCAQCYLHLLMGYGPNLG